MFRLARLYAASWASILMHFQTKEVIDSLSISFFSLFISIIYWSIYLFILLSIYQYIYLSPFSMANLSIVVGGAPAEGHGEEVGEGAPSVAAHRQAQRLNVP